MAITTFCWFPPESSLTSFDPVPLIRKREMPLRGEVLGARGGDPAGRRDAGIVPERKVLGDRLRQDEALRLAILGNEDDPVIEGVARSRELEDVAVDLDAAGGDRIRA